MTSTPSEPREPRDLRDPRWAEDPRDEGDMIRDPYPTVPLWVKMALPIIGAAFVSFVIFTQLAQIKSLNRLHIKKDAEIAELLRIRNMRSEEFAQLKSSMAVKTEMIRRVAVRVGVTESEIRTLIEHDPMAKP